MARTKFGGGEGSYLVNSANGAPVPGFPFQVWDAETAGSRVTDLLNADGDDVDVVTSDSFGRYKFSGPDGYDRALWAVGTGGTRQRVDPADLADRVVAAAVALAALQETVDGLPQDILDDAAEAAGELMSQHLLADDPHPQYPQMKGTAAGADIWGTTSGFDAATPDGDYTFVGA